MSDNMKMESFEEAYSEEKPEISFERGVTDVPLSCVIGTVGKYRDFENSTSFEDLERENFLSEILKKNGEFEPVELYKLKDSYYILDGHHRIKAAAAAGLEKIKARVIEYLPPRNSPENVLTWERSRFERMTGLDNIVLTEISMYDKLINQIREHKYYKSEEAKCEISFSMAAKDWYENIFRTVVAVIRENELLRDYPGRTEADLYVWASERKWLESQKLGYDMGFNAAVSSFIKRRHDRLFSVIETVFFPKKQSSRRRLFMERTGLCNITVSKDYSYGLLLKQIKEHKYYLSQSKKEEVSLKEAANDWYYEIYLPVFRLLEKERLGVHFPAQTCADLYIKLSEFKWLESEKEGYDVGFERAVKEFMSQQKPSQKIRQFLHKIIDMVLRK